MNEDEVAGFAEGAPAWSNDGLKVAYASEYDTCNDFNPVIIITDRFGLTKRAIKIVGAHMRWLPGDTELVISAGRFGGQLVIYNLNTDEITPLGIFSRFPQFDVSEDGKFIFFNGEALPPNTGGFVFSFEMASGKVVPLVHGGSPAISPDGLTLAYVSGGVHLLNLVTMESVTIHSFGGFPEWTADGASLILVISNGVIGSTDLMDNTKPLIGQPGAKGAGGPIDVSPDGRTILFLNYTEADDFYHIWRMNIDGSQARRLLAF